jgi:hypothetical protein
MAVILHYVLLVDFCLMLAMGIEVAYSVLYVMPSKSGKGWLLPAAWSEVKHNVELLPLLYILPVKQVDQLNVH